MIDTHCHIDMYTNPLQVADECEKLGIITIGMTNLPSHFELGFNYLLKYRKVRLALGMHPLHAELHAKEFNRFVRNLSKTSYIGEIGLDFSKDGISTKDIQLKSFEKILQELSGKKKIVSLHSRKAEKVVLELLLKNNIQNAIFHWYSGPPSLINEIIKAGYYFSINPAMIKSKSGQEIIKRIPVTNLLTESDGPFIENNSKPVRPYDVKLVEDYLTKLWKLSYLEVTEIINYNFKKLLSTINIM